MRELQPSEIIELLGAYSLDAVEDWERTQIDAYLEHDPRAATEVRGHLEVAALLTDPDLDHDAALGRVWDGIADRLDPAPPPLRLAPVIDRARLVPRAPARQWYRVAGGLAAAAAVIAVALLGGRVLQQDRRIDDLTASLAGNRLEQVAASAVTAPGAEVVTLSAPDGAEVAARIVLQPDGVGYLLSDDLPSLANDRTYQLWAIIDDTVVSAGVFGPDPKVSPFQVTGSIDGFAITEEVTGGVVASENDPIAVWLRNA